MIPFQITFQDFNESHAVWMAVQNRIEKLERRFDRIARCEVVLSCPHRHRNSDRLFKVHVRLEIPGKNVVVAHNHPKDEAHRDVFVAIRDTFDAVDRVLNDRLRILQGKVKKHRLGSVTPEGQGPNP